MKFQLEDEQQAMRQPTKKSRGSFIAFLVTRGIVKNERQAQIVLLVAIVVGFLLTAYVLFFNVLDNSVDPKYIYDPAIHD